MKREKKEKIAIQAQIRQKATKIQIQKLNKFKLGILKKDQKVPKLEKEQPKTVVALLQVPILNLNYQTTVLMTASSQF